MNIEFDTWFKKHYLSGLAQSNRFETMYIALDLFLKNNGKVIVETGVTRKADHWLDGMSTIVFGSFSKKYHCQLHAVDVNPESIQVCKSLTNECKEYISYHTSDSVVFLQNFKQKIDLLYLDSMDCPGDDAITSEQLIQSQQHQLAEMTASMNKLSDDPIILLDDNDYQNGGKTRLTKFFLEQQGFQEIMSWKQSLWVLHRGLKYNHL